MLLNFQKQFVRFIEAGTKTHTIRATRKYPAKVGETLHLYTGLRARGKVIQKLASGEVVREKAARLIGRYPCVKVEEIEIGEVRHGRSVGDVWISGAALQPDECEALARRDGFESFVDMMKFWDGRLPFSGQIIHWKKEDKQHV